MAPDRGWVALDGARLPPQGGASRRRLGYVPEATDLLPHLSVCELLQLTAALKGSDLPSADAIERLGVGVFIDQRLGSLSLGQRRRALLLAGLIGDPDLYLLDEPTNGLDRDGWEALVMLIADRVAAGKLVMVATHDREFAERVSPRTVELVGGKLSLE
jgi:ABC-type multidrug transport system ATPase subunit